MYELDALSPEAMFIASNAYSVATHEMKVVPSVPQYFVPHVLKDESHVETIPVRPH